VVISPGRVGRRVVANYGPTLDLIVTSLLSAWRSGMARSRVELFEQIRRDWRAGEVSIRELAVRHHVHRRTVRQAVASAVPPPRKAYPPRARPAIGPYAAVIDKWLLADRDVPRKQRHTARRVWQRLVAEHGASVAEVTVSRYVARRRAELGLDNIEVMVPQSHEPGAEAEVDFGEFHAMIAGALLKLWMFVMRLSCSGRAFHVAFATQAQEAFLRGTCWRSSTSARCRAGSGMTTWGPRWCGCCAAGTGPSPSGSSRCAAITGSTRSSAPRAETARTRRAG
jgi:hypothetical protein